jgi:methionyl-tRNA formyltransferase
MPEFRKIISADTLWGELWEPARPKTNNGSGLRVVLFISCNCGNNVLKNLWEYEKRYPHLLNIVGVATDDPVDPAARITLKKRIWSQYRAEERSMLKDKLVNTCMEIGIPCYTGAVKTDYFREMYKAWNPEVLIMFCFGQWLDPFIFGYPKRGAYNLHPSDLPKKIGAGTQPFQNAIQSGRKSAPLVIHLIGELIDMGPIVGLSPQVNIMLANGTYPASLLTLLEKITSIGGWMCVQLVHEIIGMKIRGEKGPAVCIDFRGLMSEAVRNQLQVPAVDDITEMYTVPPHHLLTN